MMSSNNKNSNNKPLQNPTTRQHNPSFLLTQLQAYKINYFIKLNALMCSVPGFWFFRGTCYLFIPSKTELTNKSHRVSFGIDVAFLFPYFSPSSIIFNRTSLTLVYMYGHWKRVRRFEKHFTLKSTTFAVGGKCYVYLINFIRNDERSNRFKKPPMKGCSTWWCFAPCCRLEKSF